MCIHTDTQSYRLCPRCFRAVPLENEETYCPNDGEKLLTACRRCDSPLTNPYAHHCVRCGHDLSLGGGTER